MSKPVTFDHLKSSKKPATRSIRIALDSDMAEVYSDAQAKLQTAKFSVEAATPERKTQAQKDLAKARKEAAEAEEAIKENSIKFTFRTIGRRRFEKLVEDNQPTPDQKEKTPEIDWNPDTFPPKIIAESLVEPELTEEQVQELWDSEDWSSGDLEALFLTAIMVNRSRSVVELGNG